MPILAAFLCGLIFGAGLVISGMTDTARVLGFLDVLAIPKGGMGPDARDRDGSGARRIDPGLLAGEAARHGRCSLMQPPGRHEPTSIGR